MLKYETLAPVALGLDYGPRTSSRVKHPAVCISLEDAFSLVIPGFLLLAYGLLSRVPEKEDGY